MTDALPYEYSFDFSQGLGDWSTWMQPSLIGPFGSDQGFVRLQAPGTLDPNHIDDIGSLSLIAHLSTPGSGSPGYFDLRDAEIDLVIRGHDFDAHGAKIVFWVCTTLPDGQQSAGYPVAFQITNWANTGNDLASRISDSWQTITVRLDDDPANWTEAGNYGSMQGDWAQRYVPLDLDQALARVNATLHLVAISDRPDDRPTGFLDLASITIRTAQPAAPNGHTAPERIVHIDEDGTASGTLARTGDAAAGVRYALVEDTLPHGAITLDGATGAYTITPDHDFAGNTSFRYVRIVAGTAEAPLQVAVQVAARNDAPVAAHISEDMSLASNTPFAFTLLHGNDVDGDHLTFRLVDGSVEHGTLALDAATGRYTFTPDAGYVGAAGFSYVVSDGQADSAAKHVSLTVVAQPDPLPSFGDVLADTPDAFVRDVIRLALEKGDMNASYHYANWLLSGQHVARDTAGAATFYRQGLGASPDAAVQLAQLYIAGDGVTRDYAQARTLLAGAGDDAAAVFRLAMLDYLGLGATADVTMAAGGFLFAAKLGHVEAMATIGRRYLAGDGVAASMDDAYFWLTAALAAPGDHLNGAFASVLAYDRGQAAASLTAERVASLYAAATAWRPGNDVPVNDAPLASSLAESANGTMGTTIAGSLLAGSDPDGDRLTWILTDDVAAHGRIRLDAKTGAFSYTPTPGFFGETHFSYAVSDGHAVSAPKTVTLTVARATVAFDDNVSIAEAGVIARSAGEGVLANDVSRDASALTVVSVDGAASKVGVPIATSWGTLVLAADGGFSYRADRAGALIQGQQVTETIAYDVADAHGTRSTAMLVIHVDGRSGTVLTGHGVLMGTPWDDHLIGGIGADYLIGGDGDDVLEGGAGAANQLQGGRGDDLYIVTAAGDTVIEFAGEGIDTVHTTMATHVLREHVENLVGLANTGQVLSGNTLANTITGGSGDDVIDGDAGNDVLEGGAGNNRLDGGTGNDTVDYGRAPAGVYVSLASGTASNGHGGRDSLIAIENVRGSAFDDVLIGDAGANRLEGGAGRDYLIGGDGDDVLEGGAGAANQLQGGRGDDLYIVTAAGDTVIEFAGEGIDTVHTTMATHVLREHVENLVGLANTGQVLSGNTLANTITGGSGDDVIDGDAGNDVLEGGAGRDTFVFSAPAGIADADHIVDFRSGEDRIALSSAIFGGVAGQSLSATAFAIGAEATDTGHRIGYDPVTGTLWYDPDGSGSGQAMIFGYLAPGSLLTASDLIFV